MNQWKGLALTMAFAGNFGLALALLWHFSNILMYGEFLIQELSPVMLWAEVGLIVGVMIGNLIVWKHLLHKR